MRKTAIIAALLALTVAASGGCGSTEKRSSKKDKSEKTTKETSAVADTTAEAETDGTEEDPEGGESTTAASQTESFDDMFLRKSVDQLSPVTWDYDDSDFKVKTVGDDKFGHIDIPEDWFLDEDVALLTDSILTYENKPYDLNGQTAMDSVILEVVQPYMVRDKVEDIMYDALEDDNVTEMESGGVNLDGKEGAYMKFKLEKKNKIMMHMFVTDDAESEAYFIVVESSNPDIIDLYKTYKRPVKES